MSQTGAVTGIVPSGVVLRFAVVAADGRRGSEWRVWTGDRRPTDEVYVAPRSGGDRAKISLHSDGYSQHGPTRTVRDKLRPEDRRAFDRWNRRAQLLPGWEIGCVLCFADSELLANLPPLQEKVVEIAAAPTGRMLIVLVVVVAAPPPTDVDLGPIQMVAYLERARGGAVAVCAIEVPHDQGWIDDSRELLRMPRSVWTLPEALSEEKHFAWAHGEGSDGSRRILELAPRTPAALRQGTLEENFVGEVRQWDELPFQVPQGTDFCAVLQVSRDGKSALYVDDRSRCNHAHLADDVAALIRSFKRGQLDAGWDQLPDGTYATGVLLSSAAVRAGRQAFRTKRSGPSAQDRNTSRGTFPEY